MLALFSHRVVLFPLQAGLTQRHACSRNCSVTGVGVRGQRSQRELEPCAALLFCALGEWTLPEGAGRPSRCSFLLFYKHQILVFLWLCTRLLTCGKMEKLTYLKTTNSKELF